MSIKPFHLAQHDTYPPYPFHAKDSQGNGIDLTGATVVCTMKLKGESTPKIDRVGGAAITILNQTTDKGRLDYNWQTGDSDTSPAIDPKTGEPTAYYIEAEVTLASGKKFTIPRADQGRCMVIISPGLDNV